MHRRRQQSWFADEPPAPCNPPPPEARNAPDFTHVRDWIFDLDNTLYRADNGIFAQIDANMTRFVARLLGMERDAARAIQKQLYRDHGTTLAGLVAVHKIDPEPYLDFVHDIDLSDLLPDRNLRDALMRLPGRRFVFTNGCRNHAARILERLELGDLFEQVYRGIQPPSALFPNRGVRPMTRRWRREILRPPRPRCSRISPAIWWCRTIWE